MDEGIRSTEDATSPLTPETVLRDFAAHPYQSLDGDGDVVAVNEAWLDLLGYDRDEVEGESFGEFLVSSSADRADPPFPDAREDGRISDLELEVRHADGHSIVVSLDGRAEYDGGRVARTHCQLRDVTGRERRREKLERYEAVVAGSTDIATIIDADGVITYVSPSVRRVLGYDPTDLIGESGFDYQPPADREAVAEAIEAVIDDPETTRTVDVRFRRADGSTAWIEASMRNFLDHEAIGGVLVNSREITRRKENEQELKRYRAFVENSSDVITVVDDAGVVEYVSPASSRVSGHRPGELIGTDAFSHVHPDDRAEIRGAFADLLEDPEATNVGEYRFRRTDGSWAWIESTGINRLDDDLVEGVVLVSRDITERKEQERELRRLSREYEALLDNATDAIFLLDVEETGSGVEFIFERLSSTHEETTGLRTADVRGKRPREVFDEETATEIAANYRRCVESREPITYEETLSMPEGEFVWQTSLAPVVVDGDVTRIVGIARDVTERKAYERRVEDQRDNLDILNQVLRHDIRNDLQLVTAYGDLLREHVDEEGEEYLETLRRSADHAVELTTTARDIADVMLATAADRKRVDLRSVLEGVVDGMRSTHPEALVTVEGPIPHVAVLADDMLSSVFRNLLKNAVQHNDADVAEVTVSATELADDVVVRVEDNGPGIPDGQTEAIFGKGEKGLDSDGTGMGLYLVQRLVDTYGGDVRVEDAETGGAAFVVELPTVE
jgi:PAS domain S-box-containing protein